MMDELGKMIGGLAGDAGSGSGGEGGLVGALGGLVGGEGALEGLVGQLTAGGLGDEAGSWVAKGPNKPVAPERLKEALGDGQVSGLAATSGLDVGTLMPILAAALPAVIDTLTPDGKVPAGDAARGVDIGGLLEGLGEAALAGPDSPLAQLGGLLGGSGGGAKS